MAFRVETTGSALTDLKNSPRVSGGQGATSAGEAPKSLGETPPRIVPLSDLGELASLFAKGGIVSKLKRKLNKLKGKKCRVTPAKGTIACVDSNDLVYLGVEFLQECHANEDIIAGVMAHEWGHSCAHKPVQEQLDSLNWNQIFALRREHETLADEISGRLMALMDYDPKHLIAFLKRKTGGTHNLKYHDSETRAKIVMNGFQQEKKKIKLANELFPSSAGYRNQYHSTLLDDDI
jgi:hypothetical protein